MLNHPGRSQQAMLPDSRMPSVCPEYFDDSKRRSGRVSLEQNKMYKRTKVIDEIIQSEASFIRQLELVNSLYIQPIIESKLFSAEYVSHKLFPGMQALLALHRQLYNTLTEAVSEDSDSVPVAEIFLQIRDYMKVHSDFAPQHAEASALLINLYKENKSFHTLIDSIAKEPWYGLPGLNSLRQAAVTRLPRYVLLLKELQKHTPVNSQQYRQLGEAQASYADLTGRVDQFLKKSADAQFLSALDRNMSGNRATLADSGKITRTHHWKRVHLANPTLCAWCAELLPSTASVRQCTQCDIVVHSKNCRALIQEKCKTGVLLQNGRELVNSYSVVHSCMFVNARHESNRSKPKKATALLFNDSLLIYYGDETAPQLVTLVRWYSHTNRFRVHIQDSSDCCVTVTSPRDSRIHFLTLSSPDAKTGFFNKLMDTSSSWFLEHKDFLDEDEIDICEEDDFNAAEPFNAHPIRFHITLTVPVQDFTAYVIEIHESWHVATIIKRYSEFYSMHRKLRHMYSRKKLPKLPSKRYIHDNVSLLFVQRRCRKLERYLNELMKLDGIQEAEPFREFRSTTLEPGSSKRRDVEEPSEESMLSPEQSEDQSLELEETPLTDMDLAPIGRMREAFDPDLREEWQHGLKVEKGKYVVILYEPNEVWWYCQTDDNRVGYVPSAYVNLV